MTDRGVPTTDGSSACPFVAFEDDRDERADRPDHRHRCFAEAVPAPRALAHQEAYCLSSAFPVCPTFQDWARREAAQARPGRAGTPAGATVREEAEVARADDDDSDGGEGDREDDLWSTANDVPIEERPRRNPPRDWAAPPPWAAGSGAGAGGPGGGGVAGPGVGGLGALGGAAGGDLGAASRDDSANVGVPEESRGLAGSAADRLARGEDPDHAWIAAHPRSTRDDGPATPSAPPDPELAGLVRRRGGGLAHPEEEARDSRDAGEARDVPPVRPGRRPTVSSTRDRSRDRERDRDRERADLERVQHDGPSWERARRYEAYPSIKTRAGLANVPPLPRVVVLAGALAVAAVLLLLLPTILNIGGRVEAPGSSSSPSGAVASESLEPTPIPEATPQIYTIKAGDALARIARRFGLTLEQLLAANKNIKDANKIKVGDKIVIPTPPPAEAPAGTASPSASPSP